MELEKWKNETKDLHCSPCHHGHNNIESRLLFKPDENPSSEDGIRIEPASNSKISMRSPLSNAVTSTMTRCPLKDTKLQNKNSG